MRAILTVIAAACCLSLSHAQSLRLYDRTKDDAAQLTLDAAKKIAGGSLFDAELKNLDAFAKLEVDSTFAGEARVRTNLLNAIASGKWNGVSTLVHTLQAQLQPDEIAKKIADAQAERDRLQKELNKLAAQKPAPGPALPGNPAQAIADLIDKGIDADTAAASLAGNLKKPDPNVQRALDLVGKALAEGKTTAALVAANQKEVVDTATALQKLRSSLNSLAMDRIKIDLDQQKILLKIWQRAAEDTKQTLSLMADYDAGAATIDANARVIDTIRSQAAVARQAEAACRAEATREARASGQAETTRGGEGVRVAEAECGAEREKLDKATRLTFLAAAIAARWNSADMVARLREAHAKHRYSIQRSRLEAHAFEVAVGSGAQRLAYFYKGGVRPEMIAQILYTAATASVSATVAATR